MIDLSGLNLYKLPNNIPTIIEESFDCHENNLTSLVGSPKECLIFDCELNDLTSLFGISEVIKISLWCRLNPLLTDVSDLWNSTIGNEVNIELNHNLAVLPLVKFKTTFFGMSIVSSIVERNRGDSKKNVIECQYDLIKCGYGDHAKWKPF